MIVKYQDDYWLYHGQRKRGKKMDLTPELKAEIDAKSHYELLSRWRFAPAEDTIFQGESGKYWGERMAEKRAENPAQAVADSKALSR